MHHIHPPGSAHDMHKSFKCFEGGQAQSDWLCPHHLIPVPPPPPLFLSLTDLFFVIAALI